MRELTMQVHSQLLMIVTITYYNHIDFASENALTPALKRDCTHDDPAEITDKLFRHEHFICTVDV